MTSRFILREYYSRLSAVDFLRDSSLPASLSTIGQWKLRVNNLSTDECNCYSVSSYSTLVYV